MGNSFSFVDVVVVVVLLGSAGFAFMRGFVHEMLSIAAWAGAVAAALYGFPVAQPFFRAQIGSVWLADGLAALALFLIALLVLSLLTKAASNTVQNSALGSVDSSLGFVFGLARGALLLSVATLVVGWLSGPDEPPGWLAQAKTRPWLARGATIVAALAPDNFGRAEKEAREASGRLAEDARRARDLEKAYRDFTAPPQPPQAPIAEPAKRGDGGKAYDREQRREMDRLFQSTQ
ncbi:MAG: CvpA family protein [Magnetospirillum sp.]|nr:CvpA family protein [Magnetospirillum sp.]